MPKSMITLKDVWKTYNVGEVDVHALRGVSLEVKKGEFAAIVGPSGSGKSTMMNMVGCLDLPSSGQVFLDGDDIQGFSESRLASTRGRKIGFVFQQFNLIPTLTALENVMLPLEFQDMDASSSRERALELLNLVDLQDRAKHLPSQLSGGEMQRVAIARSLSSDPEIILADEPTGNLDSKTGEFILGFLDKIHRKEGKTIIVVTHDMSLARHAERIIHIKDGKIDNIEPRRARK